MQRILLKLGKVTKMLRLVQK